MKVEIRCRCCGKLLFRIEGRAQVEVRCPRRRCQAMQTHDVDTEAQEAKLTLSAA